MGGKIFFVESGKEPPASDREGQASEVVMVKLCLSRGRLFIESNVNHAHKEYGFMIHTYISFKHDAICFLPVNL